MPRARLCYCLPAAARLFPGARRLGSAGRCPAPRPDTDGAGGESYFDIISRLDPLIHELESYHEPILIVSHQAVLRMLYAYLMGIDRMDAPRLAIPLHTVIKLTYDGWTQCVEQQIYLGPDVPKDEQSS